MQRSKPHDRPAVFLDRDGTLIEERGFLDDPGGVEILPTVVDALRLLHRRGFATVVVSNQSGVARGYFDDEAVRAQVHREHVVPRAGIDRTFEGRADHAGRVDEQTMSAIANWIRDFLAF